MADKTELAKQYMALFQDQEKQDEMLAMLADDIVMSNPMSGTISGKDALTTQMQNRPAGAGAGGMDITWADPEESGDAVKIVGTGSPFGPVQVLLSFNDDDKINKIDIGLAS